MDSLARTTPVDSEIVNENYVAADSEIDSDSEVISGFTFFFIGYLHYLRYSVLGVILSSLYTKKSPYLDSKNHLGFLVIKILSDDSKPL